MRHHKFLAGGITLTLVGAAMIACAFQGASADGRAPGAMTADEMSRAVGGTGLKECKFRTKICGYTVVADDTSWKNGTTDCSATGGNQSCEWKKDANGEPI